jgi:hypothetical protein
MRIHAFSTQFKTSGLELQPFPLLFARHAVWVLSQWRILIQLVASFNKTFWYIYFIKTRCINFDICNYKKGTFPLAVWKLIIGKQNVESCYSPILFMLILACVQVKCVHSPSGCTFSLSAFYMNMTATCY